MTKFGKIIGKNMGLKIAFYLINRCKVTLRIKFKLREFPNNFSNIFIHLTIKIHYAV